MSVSEEEYKMDERDVIDILQKVFNKYFNDPRFPLHVSVIDGIGLTLISNSSSEHNLIDRLKILSSTLYEIIKDINTMSELRQITIELVDHTIYIVALNFYKEKIYLLIRFSNLAQFNQVKPEIEDAISVINHLIVASTSNFQLSEVSTTDNWNYP